MTKEEFRIIALQAASEHVNPYRVAGLNLSPEEFYKAISVFDKDVAEKYRAMDNSVEAVSAHFRSRLENK